MGEISLDHLDRQLTRVLDELAALRKEIANAAKKATVAPPPLGNSKLPSQYVSLRDFYEGMLGLSRGWYNHRKKDADFPKAIVIMGKPRLLRDACEAYIAKHASDPVVIDGKAKKAAPKQPSESITIKEFCSMVGQSRTWYHTHKWDSDFPQAKWNGGGAKKMFSRAECEAYAQAHGLLEA